MTVWRSAFRPEVGFFLLCWLGLQAHFRERAFNDPGALWHVKVGERILASGFMHEDPFTYTFTGHVWIPQQWGGEIAMALAHRTGGFDTLLLGLCSIVAGLFTWIFSRAVRNGMHPALAAVVVGGAVVVSGFHFYARPHMITLVGMGLTLAWIVDTERGRCSPWRLWCLIPLYAVWTNIHGGVLGGVLTLGSAVAGWCVLFLVSPTRERGSISSSLARRANGIASDTPVKSRRSLMVYCGIVAACALTPFLNPFGMEMIHTWKRIVSSEAMKELVSEHQPLSLNHTAGQVIGGFGCFYLFMLLGTVPKRPRVSWILPLVWFALSVQSIRQGPLFAVLAAVAIADLWPETLWYRLLKKHGDSLAREPDGESRGWLWTTVPIAAVLACLGLQMSGIEAPIIGRGWARLDARQQPVELVGDLRNYSEGVPPGTRIFNDANLGGFVLYHAPKLKIFMDDRFELYGDDWMRRYVRVVYEEPDGIEGWADEYGFDHAFVMVLPDGDRLPLERYLSDSARWACVARCERGALFRRKPSPCPISP
jgi:hypothetical protein